MEPCAPRPSTDKVVQHAQASGLSVERVETFGQSAGAVGRAFGQLFGSFKPDYVERYLLAAPDGMRWVYVQPYSGQAAMPGEHHFPLWGAPAAPVLGEGSSWFDENRRLALRLGVLLTATILLAPLGIFLLIKILPRPPKLTGGPLAVRFNALPQLTRLRYMGGVLSRDYLIDWSLQLHSVGAGQSRLVCRDPATTKRGFGILRGAQPAFAEMADLARGMQEQMPREDHYAQEPPKPVPWDELASPWLADAASADRPQLAPPGVAAPGSAFGAPALPPSPALVSAPPKPPSQTGLWFGFFGGIIVALFGLLWVGLGLLISLDPTEAVGAQQGGWICLGMAVVLCVIPGGALTAYTGKRLFAD